MSARAIQQWVMWTEQLYAAVGATEDSRWDQIARRVWAVAKAQGAEQAVSEVAGWFEDIGYLEASNGKGGAS